ncbi:hypothetical protein LO80_01925 [Candidatus Francisella endociliophora]|uniref:GDSL family lipase n=1 Tax=Candidatus Francisella endociliophora TaxID=653937 RepID=A0A097EMR1_9GAMM|nr:hypothetical protein LO80_01925 [Francisella sp. FSC1006]
MLLVLTIVSGAYAKDNTHYKNFIVFGDSISDTGNLPENYLLQNSAEDLPMNYVVPVTNPIAENMLGTNFQMPSFVADNYPDMTWAWSVPNSEYAELSHPNKEHYSFGWFDYFIYNTYPQANTPSMVNWIDLYRNPNSLKDSTSLNYAVVGAMTIDGYTNPDYFAVTTPVDEGDIGKEQEQVKSKIDSYTKSVSNDNWENLAVAGVIKQIKFYLYDKNKYSQLQDNTDTAYIVWIGANDISNAMLNKLLKGKLNAFKQDIGTFKLPGNIANNIQEAVKMLEKQAGAKHIYVINAYNLGLTPTARNFGALYSLPSLISQALNAQLEILFVNDSNVKVIDMGSKLDKAIVSREFVAKAKKTETCSKDYFSAQVIENNCYYKPMSPREGYPFWNNSHLAQPMQQIIAFELMNKIINEPFLERANVLTIQNPEKIDKEIAAIANSIVNK